MQEQSPPFDLIIIGAGLTGLTLAYTLRESGMRIGVIEARGRVGGRIHTTTPSSSLPPQEMGATWLHRPHRQLIGLLDELRLNRYEQIMGPLAIYEQSRHVPAQLIELPQNQESSHRIHGGTSALIQALANQIPAEWIKLNVQVTSLLDKGDTIEVKTTSSSFPCLSRNSTGLSSAKQVVSTLPPNLFVQTISGIGSLPEELLSACAKTHTWMGESIRVSIAYREPFWRKPNTAGTIFSNAGPITEFYDHSSVEDDTFAMMGFMNGALAKLPKEERKRQAIAQLQKLYGPQAADFLAYNEVVWRDEPFTFDPNTEGLVPHQNNGIPTFRKCFWNNKFFIGGSETARSHPGYMEGAVVSAQWLADQIKQA